MKEVRKAAREGVWLPGGVNRRIAFLLIMIRCNYDDAVKEV